MTKVPETRATDGVATYLGRGDPADRFADYYPAWVDKMPLGCLHLTTLNSDGQAQHIAANYGPAP